MTLPRQGSANHKLMIEGSAAICLLSEHMTVVRQRIDTNVPRKRKGGTSGHDKVGH